MKSRALLVYNPNSGGKNFAQNLDYITECFQGAGYHLTLHRLDWSDSLPEQIAEGKFNKIIAAGGDGTLNQVVSAMLKNNIQAPLAIYPVGTCNDFASQFNMPKSLEKLTDIAVGDNCKLCDAGLVNGEYFVNVFSFGMFVTSGQRTDDAAKSLLGPFAYYFTAMEDLIHMEPVHVHIRTANTDFAVFDGDLMFAVILNGRSAGGFNKLSLVSEPGDGLLDVFLFKMCSLIEIPGLLFDLLNGKHLNNPNVICFKTDKLSITGNPALTDKDGEKGPELPLEISVVPGALKICVP